MVVAEVEATVERPTKPHCDFTNRGLVITGDLTEAEWENVGRRCGRRSDAIRWAIGDWLAYGYGRTKTFRGPDGYAMGSIYDKATKITGYTRSILWRMYKTSVSFPMETRVHAEIVRHRSYMLATSLPPEQRLGLIELAADKHWSTVQVAQYLEASGTKFSKHMLGGGRGWSVLRVRCPNCANTFVAREHLAKKEKKVKSGG
jgi:hypothetical protein